MTTITTLSYKELQSWAKENNIKANQKQEVLQKLHAEAHAPKVEENPFTAYMPKQQTYTAPTTNGFPPSEKVLKYLTDLRTRHRRSLEGLSTITYKEAQAEIEELRVLPAPASDKQIEIIRKTIKEMQDNGAKINISDEKINSLTGGAQGTASKMIEFLFTQRQKMTIVSAPSDNQIERLVEWFLCPDIPFENYEINKKIPMPHVSEKAWRYMLPDEFKEELKAKLTRADASRMIDEYRGTFYKWKSSRVSKSQMSYIRQLDERLARMESQAEVTFAIDMEGNVHEVSTANKNTYAPRAYEPLTDWQLAQLSADEADVLINQMKSELSEQYSGSFVDHSQQELNEKISAFNERTGAGVAKDANEARIREFRKLEDLIYKLEARIGHENEELHDMIKEVLVDGGGDSQRVFLELRSFMQLAIDETDEDTRSKSVGALLIMTEDTEIGTKVAQGLAI